MKVTISSSSSTLIDDIYLKESRKIIDFLAQKQCDLNWGSASISVMGECYEGFKNHNRKINGYTTKKYADDIYNLPAATHTIYDDTFDLKKNIYNDADLVVCLPGGTGTVSEFLSYVEESRSNDNPRNIVLCNINGQFDKLLELIDTLINEKFNSNSIYDYFKIINTYEEFVDYFNTIK